MTPRRLLPILTLLTALGAVAWWVRTPAAPVVVGGPRILPRLVGPGTEVRCTVGGVPAQGARWTLDGEPWGEGAAMQAPDRVGGVLACAVGEGSDVVGVTADPAPGNVLLVILDDVGIDRIGLYGVSERTPTTPTLEGIAARGVLFRNAYANPSCTPTRAGVLTGRYAMNLGIGNALAPDEQGLRRAEWTLPEALDHLTSGRVSHAALGKWHLTAPGQGDDAPQVHGFQHFAGNITNLATQRGETYRSWTRVEDGVAAPSRAYATTDNVDSALRFIRGARERPWFVWLAFNSAHVPLHVPPEELLDGPVPPDPTDADRFDLMVAAADRELGRLLRTLPTEVRRRTTVIVLGDNGTAQEAVRPPTPRDRAKFSLYEGGVHVPLLVAGPVVTAPGREVTHPVSHVDLFPTILELAGGALDDAMWAHIEGRSLLVTLTSDHAPAPRDHVYAEQFHPNGFDLDRRKRWGRMVRVGPYKLVRPETGPDELYRVGDEGLDGRGLLAGAGPPAPEVQAALVHLRELLRRELRPAGEDDVRALQEHLAAP